MTEVIDIRQGYKVTKIGLMPKDWQLVQIASFNISLTSGVSVNSGDRPKKEGEIGVLKTSSVFDGSFNSNENKVISDPKEVARAKLNPREDTLLISRMNTPELVGACAYIAETRDDLYIPDRLWKGEFNTKVSDVRWLNYLLNSGHYKGQIKNRASGTSNSMKNISKPSFLGIYIPLPTLPEQQKIAEILSTWDKAISTTQNLIEELKLRNKGLAEELLTGKKRLKGFEGIWEEHQLEHYFKEKKETNHSELPLLSIGEIGVYPHTDSNKKDTSNEDKSKYKRISPGDIGYNTMRMWQGRSALSSLEGIVSPAYTIVTPKKNADAEFFAYLFKLDEVIHKFFRKSQGLVSDTLNCKFKDFKIVKVLTPPSIDEQKAITTVLQKAEEELKLYQQQLDTIKEQKKGLMQKLLTGEIRVKTNQQ